MPRRPPGWSHFDDDRWELFHIESDRSQCHDLAAENPDKLEELKALWFAEAAKYNGLPLARPEHPRDDARGGGRTWSATARSYVYYPGTAEVGIGRGGRDLRGRSFSVLAEVTSDPDGAEGVLVQTRWRHTVDTCCSCRTVGCTTSTTSWARRSRRCRHRIRCPLGSHMLGCRATTRTGTVEGSHTPLGDVALYIDGAEVATCAGMRSPPRDLRSRRRRASAWAATPDQPVSRRYQAPFPFTGGTIAQVIVDVSGTPYVDLERELAAAFAKD